MKVSCTSCINETFKYLLLRHLLLAFENGLKQEFQSRLSNIHFHWVHHPNNNIVSVGCGSACNSVKLESLLKHQNSHPD